ncbi:uncharacterized protein [Diadema antillarum]|uniref:uncharacterized protein isoform X3 n=1 Tax=Diadema antillarum TaxID=105358 RepID=UPI003A870284
MLYTSIRTSNCRRRQRKFGRNMARQTPSPHIFIALVIFLSTTHQCSGLLYKDPDAWCTQTVETEPSTEMRLLIIRCSDLLPGEIPEKEYGDTCEVMREVTTEGSTQIIDVCCDGYSGGACLPVCDPPCGDEGICESPNFCKCNKGHSGATCEIKDAETSEEAVNTCHYGSGGQVRTFDGYTYYYPGECVYTLFQFESYTITIDTSARPPIVTLSNDDISIELMENQQVNFNSRPKLLPFYPTTTITVRASGMLLMIEEQAGFVITYNGEGAVNIHLPNSAANDLQARGLCGNFDFDPSDDVVGSLASFGEQMEVDPDNTCSDLTDEMIEHPCSGLPNKTQIAIEAVCRSLHEDPFSACNNSVKYDHFQHLCQFEMCGCVDGGREVDACTPCDSLGQYAYECARNGYVIDWRREDFCHHPCESDKAFTECGSACPSTCFNLEINDGCSETCVPGCFCPNGTYWDGESCKKETECPCMRRDLAMPVGAMFHVPCKTCTCVSGDWDCRDVPCDGMCAIYGGSNFKTFDGLKFDVYTKCQYTLLRVEGDEDVPSFHVSIDTTKCSQDNPANCLNAISLDVGEGANKTSYAITQDSTILRHGEVVSSPSSKGGILVRKLSEYYFIMDTDFGMQILWSVKSASAYVFLNPSLKGKTKGLCGTYNDSPKDDFTWFNGVVETVAARFAYACGLSTTCTDTMSTSDSCTTYSQYAQKADDICQRVKQYPFSNCQNEVEVDTYFKKCKEDVCTCYGEGYTTEECACPSYMRYAGACSLFDIAMPSWRADIEMCLEVTNCPIPGMIFNEYGNSCLMTCSDLTTKDTCARPKLPGCYCQDGLVFDDQSQKCVDSTLCPCQYKERYYQPGAERLTRCGTVVCDSGVWDTSQQNCSIPACPSHKVWSDCACEKTCEHRNPVCSEEICDGGCLCPNDMASYNDSCIDESECPCYHQGRQYQKKETTYMDCNECVCTDAGWQCENKSCPGVCKAYGDPHYTTFDGRDFEFMGECSYTFATDWCNGNKGTFKVTVENEPCGDEGFTCTRLINMTVKGDVTLTLIRGVDPIVTPPHRVKKFVFTNAGLYMYITWKAYQIALQWDRQTSLYIILPASYRGKVCGLCGDFNDNSEDDFVMPRGNMVETSAVAFADGWKKLGSCPTTTEPTDPCVINPTRKLWSEYSCALIKQSLFEPCHNKVDPQKYYENCVFDTCACNRGGDCECLCTAITAYAKECNEQGVSIPWRTSDVCGLQCEGGQVYMSCGPQCPQRCYVEGQTVVDPYFCPNTCVEGCACPAGTVLDERRGECVLEKDCQCIVNNMVFEPGQTFMRGCQLCTCDMGGYFLCSGDICTGTPDITPGTCTCIEDHTPCRDCSMCIPIGANCNGVTDCPDHSDEEFCACEYAGEKYVDGDTWQGALPCTNCTCEKGEATCRKECNIECYNGILHKHDDKHDRCCECVPENITSTGRPVPTEKPCRLSRIQVYEDCDNCFYDSDGYLFKTCARNVADCNDDEVLVFSEDHCCQCEPISSTQEPTIIFTTEACVDTFTHGDPVCCSYISGCSIPAELTGSEVCGACANNKVFNGSDCVLKSSCPCLDENMVLREPFSSWKKPGDDCAVCYCISDEIRCSSPTCEPLTCAVEKQIKEEGSCCAVCAEETTPAPRTTERTTTEAGECNELLPVDATSSVKITLDDFSGAGPVETDSVTQLDQDEYFQIAFSGRDSNVRVKVSSLTLTPSSPSGEIPSSIQISDITYYDGSFESSSSTVIPSESQIGMFPLDRLQLKPVKSFVVTVSSRGDLPPSDFTISFRGCIEIAQETTPAPRTTEQTTTEAQTTTPLPTTLRTTTEEETTTAPRTTQRTTAEVATTTGTQGPTVFTTTTIPSTAAPSTAAPTTLAPGECNELLPVDATSSVKITLDDFSGAGPVETDSVTQLDQDEYFQIAFSGRNSNVRVKVSSLSITPSSPSGQIPSSIQISDITYYDGSSEPSPSTVTPSESQLGMFPLDRLQLKPVKSFVVTVSSGGLSSPSDFTISFRGCIEIAQETTPAPRTTEQTTTEAQTTTALPTTSRTTTEGTQGPTVFTTTTIPSTAAPSTAAPTTLAPGECNELLPVDATSSVKITLDDFSGAGPVETDSVTQLGQDEYFQIAFSGRDSNVRVKVSSLTLTPSSPSGEIPSSIQISDITYYDGSFESSSSTVIPSQSQIGMFPLDRLQLKPVKSFVVTVSSGGLPSLSDFTISFRGCIEIEETTSAPRTTKQPTTQVGTTTGTQPTTSFTTTVTPSTAVPSTAIPTTLPPGECNEPLPVDATSSVKITLNDFSGAGPVESDSVTVDSQLDEDKPVQITFSGRNSNVRVKVSSLSITPSSPSGEIPSSIQISDITYYDGSSEPSPSTVTPSESQLGMFPLDRLQLKPVKSFVVTVSSGGLPSPSDFTISFRGCIEIEETTSAPRTTKQPTTQVGTTTGTQPTTSFTTTVTPSTAVPSTAIPTTLPPGECNEPLPVDATSSVKITLNDFSGAGPVESDSVTVDSQLDEDKLVQITFSGRNSNVRVKVSSLSITPSSPSGEIPSSIQISDITYYDGSSEPSPSTVTPSESQLGMFPLDRLQLKPVKSFVVTVSSGGLSSPSDFTISFRGCIEIEEPGTTPEQTPVFTTTPLIVSTISPTTAAPTTEVISSTAAPTTAAPTEPTTSPACRDRVGTMTRNSAFYVYELVHNVKFRLTAMAFTSEQSPLFSGTYVDVDITTDGQTWSNIVTGQHINFRSGETEEIPIPDGPLVLGIRANFVISGATDVWAIGCEEEGTTTIGQSDITTPRTRPTRPTQPTTTSVTTSAIEQTTAPECYEPQEPLEAVSPLTYEASFSQPTTVTGIKIPANSFPTMTTVVFRIKRAEGDEWITLLAENADSGSGDLSGSGSGESETEGEVTFTLSDTTSTNLWLPSELGPVRAIQATFGTELSLGDTIQVYGCQGPTEAPTTRGTSPAGTSSTGPATTTAAPTEATTTTEGTSSAAPPTTTAAPTQATTTEETTTGRIRTRPTTTSATTSAIEITTTPECYEPQEPLQSVSLLKYEASFSRPTTVTGIKLPANSFPTATTVVFRIKRAERDEWITVLAENADSGSGDLSGSGSGDSETQGEVTITLSDSASTNLWLPPELGPVRAIQVTFGTDVELGDTIQVYGCQGPTEAPTTRGTTPTEGTSSAAPPTTTAAPTQATTTAEGTAPSAPATTTTAPTEAPRTTEGTFTTVRVTATTGAVETTIRTECYEPQEPLQSVSPLTYEASFSQPTTITGIKLPANSFPTATTVVFRIKRAQGDEWITVLAQNSDSGSGDLSGSGSGDSETQGEVTITLSDSSSTNLWLPSELGPVRAIQTTFGTDLDLGNTIQVYGCQEGTSSTGPATTTAAPTEATTTTEGTSSAAPSTTTAAPTQATTTAESTTLGQSEITTPRTRPTRPTTTSVTTSAIEQTTTPDCYEPQEPLQSVSPLTYEASFSQPTTITGIKLPANSFASATTIVFRIKRAEGDEWITVPAENADSGSGDLSGSGSGDSETQGEVTITLSDSASTNLWLPSELGPVRAIQVTFGTDVELGDTIQVYGCQGPTEAPTTRGTTPTGPTESPTTRGITPTEETSSAAPSTTTAAPTQATTTAEGTSPTVPATTTTAPTEVSRTTEGTFTTIRLTTTTEAVETTIRTECYEPQEPLQSVSLLTYEASFSQPTTITGIKLPASSFPTATTVVFRIKRVQGDEWITVLAENADSGSGDLSGSGSGDSETQGEVTITLSDSASTNLWLPSELGTVRAIQATFGTDVELGDTIQVYGCQGPTEAPTTRGTSPTEGTSPTGPATTTAVPTEATTTTEGTSSAAPSTTTAAPTQATTTAGTTTLGLSETTTPRIRTRPTTTSATTSAIEITTTPECYEPQGPLEAVSPLTYEASFSQPTTITGIKLPANSFPTTTTVTFRIKRAEEDEWITVLAESTDSGSGDLSGSGSGDSETQGEVTFTLSDTTSTNLWLSSEMGPVRAIQATFGTELSLGDAIQIYGCQGPTPAPTTRGTSPSGTSSTAPSTTTVAPTEETTAVGTTTTVPHKTTAALTEATTAPELTSTAGVTTTAAIETTIRTECYEPQGPLEAVSPLTYEASFSQPTTITGLKLPANSFPTTTTVVFRIKRAEGDEWTTVPAQSADSGSGDFSGSGSGDSDTQGEVTFALSDTASTNLWLPTELGTVRAIQATFGTELSLGDDINIYGCQGTTPAPTTRGTSPPGTSPTPRSTTTAAPTEGTTSAEGTSSTPPSTTTAAPTEATTAAEGTSSPAPTTTTAAPTEATTAPECYEPQNPLVKQSYLTYEATFSQPTTLTAVKLPARDDLDGRSGTLRFQVKRVGEDVWRDVISADGSGEISGSGSGSGDSQDQGEFSFTLSAVHEQAIRLSSDIGPVMGVRTIFSEPINIETIETYGCQAPTSAPTTSAPTTSQTTTLGLSETTTGKIRTRPATTSAPGTEQTTVEILETTATPEATTATVKFTTAATEKQTTPEGTIPTIRVTTTTAPTEATISTECYEPQGPLQSVGLLTYEASFSRPTTITGIKLPANSFASATTVVFRIKRADGDEWIIVPAENADSGSGDLSGSGSGDSDNQGEITFTLSETLSTNLWLPSELGPVFAIQATFGVPLNMGNNIQVYGCQEETTSTSQTSTTAASTEATSAGTSPAVPSTTTAAPTLPTEATTSPEVTARTTTQVQPTSAPGTEQTTAVIEETTATPRATYATQTTVTYTTSTTEQPTTTPECYEPQEPLQSVSLLTYEASFSQPTTITGIKLPAISASTTTTVVFRIKRTDGDEWITVPAVSTDSGSGSGDLSGSGSGESEDQGEVTFTLSDIASTNLWLPSELGPVRAIEATFGAPLNLGNEIDVYGCQGPTPAPTTRGTSPPGTSPTAPLTTTAAPTEGTTATEPTTTTGTPKVTTQTTVTYTTSATELPTTTPECYEPQEPLQSVSPLTYEASFSQPTTITGIKLPASSFALVTTVVFRIKRTEGDEWIIVPAESTDSGSGSGDLSGSGSGESESQGEVTFALSDSASTNLWLPSTLGPVRAIEVTFGAPLNLGNEIDVYGCQGPTPAPTTRGTSPPGTSPTAPSTTTAPTEKTTAAETTTLGQSEITSPRTRPPRPTTTTAAPTTKQTTVEILETTATPEATTATVKYTTEATEQPTTPEVTTSTIRVTTTAAPTEPTIVPECYEPQEPLQSVSPLTYEASFSQPTTITGIKLPATSAITTTTVVFRIKRAEGDEWITLNAQSADSGSGDLSGSGSGESENQGEVTFSLSDSAPTNLWLPSELGPVRAIEVTFGAPLNLGNEIDVYGCQGTTPAPTTRGTSPPGTSPTAPSTTAAPTEGTTAAETTATTATPKVTTQTTVTYTTSATEQPTTTPECYEPQEPLQAVSPLTYEASFSQPTTISGIKLPAISAGTTTTVVFRIKRTDGDEWIIVPAQSADSGSGDLSGSGSGESENQGEVTFSLSDSASTNLWLPSALGPVRAIEATFGAPLNLGNEIQVYGCQGPTPAPTTGGTSPPGTSPTSPSTTTAASTEGTTAAETTTLGLSETTTPRTRMPRPTTTTAAPTMKQTTVEILETTATPEATTVKSTPAATEQPTTPEVTTFTIRVTTTSAPTEPTVIPECYEPQEPLQSVSLLTYEASFSQPTTITGIKLPAISASRITTVTFRIKRAEGDAWIIVPTENADSGSGSGDLSGSGSGDSDNQGEVSFILSDTAATNLWLPSELGTVRAIQATFGAPLSSVNIIEVYGCQGASSTAPPTTMASSTEATTAEITSPKVSTRGTTTSIPGTEQTTVVIEETTAPRRATTTTQTTVTYTTSATEQPTTAPECYEPQEPLQAVGLLTYEASFSQPTTIAGIKLPAISASTTTTVVFSIKRAEGDEWITVLAENADSGSGSGDFSGSGSGDSETQGEVTVALSDSASTNIWLPSTLGPVRAIQATFGAPLNLGNEIKVYGCEAVTTTAPSTTAPESTTQAICYFAPTGESYQGGESFPYGNCETCICMVGQGIECFPDSCNLDPEDCSTGETVVHTADGCCQCRAIPTTVPTTQSATTQPCLYPMVYRENCDCHRTCDDIETPCASPSSVQVCERGCFCQEGMVLADANSTDCVTKESCVTDCEYNGNVYELGETWKDSCYDCICEPDREVQCTPVCDLTCGSGEELIYPDNNECCYCAPSPTTALPTPPPPPPSKWKV